MERPLTYVFTHAICAYRDARAAESRSLWAQALALGTPTSYGGDERLILVDKALRAAEESDEAHRLLNVAVENPEELPMDADVPELVADWWALHPWAVRDGYAVASEILADEDLRHMIRAFDVRHSQVGINSVEEGLMATVGEWWEDRAATYAY